MVGQYNFHATNYFLGGCAEICTCSNVFFVGHIPPEPLPVLVHATIQRPVTPNLKKALIIVKFKYGVHTSDDSFCIYAHLSSVVYIRAMMVS